ncbi:MAG: AAA family ATPase [Lachnospiraceae bacterium]|nr:AAA family ATPase [Lachnospiraceae bacterium]
MGKLYEFKEEDAYSFARHVRIQAKSRGEELQFYHCPYCNGGKSGKDKGTFSINLRSGQFKCLRASCAISGNMITLARDFDFHLSHNVDEYYMHKTQYRRLQTPKQPLVPKEPTVKFLQNRGISEETAKKYELTTHNKQDNVLVFPFFDENGKLQYVKYRDCDYFKGKTYINEDGKEEAAPKEWSEKNCKPILFGMKQCNPENKRIVICEGQMDSLSVSEAGIENAVSVPNGALGFTWIPHVWDWWCQFEELIVFGDFEHEHITLLDDLTKRFPGKVKHVRYEDYQDCKDANEILIKHGKEAVRKAVESAIELPVKQVKELADVKRRDLKDIPKFKTGFSLLDSYLGGYFYGGQLIILTGKRGQGKSTVVNEICVSALQQGKKIFAYSGELPDWQYKSWIDFQIAGPGNIVEQPNRDGELRRFITNSNQDRIDDWYRRKFYIFDNNVVDDDELTDLITTMENSVMQYGIDLVVVDNLMTALDVDMDKDEYRCQSKFVKKLSRLAKRHDVVVILVAHPRKNSFTKDENDAVSGSGDITNAADVVMTFKRDEETENHNYLSISKNRWFGKLTKKDGIDMWYDQKSRRLIDKSKPDFNYEVGWEVKEAQQQSFDGFVNVTDDMENPFTM